MARAAPAASRRALVSGVAAALAGVGTLGSLPRAAQAQECESCSDSNSAGEKTFTTTPSGLKYLDIRVGSGGAPREGQTVSVDWVGYTSGYQAKRIESTEDKGSDGPFTFTLGRGEAIPAFEEAVATMQPNGLRRVEIPGELVDKLGPVAAVRRHIAALWAGLGTRGRSPGG